MLARKKYSELKRVLLNIIALHHILNIPKPDADRNNFRNNFFRNESSIKIAIYDIPYFFLHFKKRSFHRFFKLYRTDVIEKSNEGV